MSVCPRWDYRFLLLLLFVFWSSTAVGWNTTQKPLSECRFFSKSVASMFCCFCFLILASYVPLPSPDLSLSISLFTQYLRCLVHLKVWISIMENQISTCFHSTVSLSLSPALLTLSRGRIFVRSASNFHCVEVLVCDSRTRNKIKQIHIYLFKTIFKHLDSN